MATSKITILWDELDLFVSESSDDNSTVLGGLRGYEYLEELGVPESLIHNFLDWYGDFADWSRVPLRCRNSEIGGRDSDFKRAFDRRGVELTQRLRDWLDDDYVVVYRPVELHALGLVGELDEGRGIEIAGLVQEWLGDEYEVAYSPCKECDSSLQEPPRRLELRLAKRDARQLSVKVEVRLLKPPKWLFEE